LDRLWKRRNIVEACQISNQLGEISDPIFLRRSFLPQCDLFYRGALGMKALVLWTPYPTPKSTDYTKKLLMSEGPHIYPIHFSTVTTGDIWKLYIGVLGRSVCLFVVR
jgi:hypothetical protein